MPCNTCTWCISLSVYPAHHHSYMMHQDLCPAKLMHQAIHCLPSCAPWWWCIRTTVLMCPSVSLNPPFPLAAPPHTAVWCISIAWSRLPLPTHLLYVCDASWPLSCDTNASGSPLPAFPCTLVVMHQNDCPDVPISFAQPALPASRCYSRPRSLCFYSKSLTQVLSWLSRVRVNDKH